VFLVLLSRQPEISALFIPVSPLVPETDPWPRPSVSFSIQIESIFMSYFLSIAGSQTKFSKSGFLLRTTCSILQQRAIELRAIHAVDLPVAEIANRDLTAQFIANTTDQVQQAAAILLLTPATKESAPTLLLTLLERLPDLFVFQQARPSVCDRWIAGARRRLRARTPPRTPSSWDNNHRRQSSHRIRELDYSR
jgi:hypothetical protein